ncbi:MAG TPA: ABC transporter permease [Nocardioides sp.]|nr:ABC transporter permease [Nocardioides sp.]
MTTTHEPGPALPPPAASAPLPYHGHGPVGRLLAALATPGGAVFVLAVALLFATIAANPNFGDPGVLIRFLGRTAPIAIVALGQYYVIVSGEFDLSMGAVIAAQVVIAGNFIGEDQSRILPGLALMLALGVAIGVVNGLVTTLLQVPSFITTLAMMLALGGLVDYLSGGAATGNPPDEFREIGRGQIEDVPVVEVIPYQLIVLAVLCVAAAWLMRRPFGRTLVAVGDNPDAAHVSGSRVWLVKTQAFVLSSLAATVAGILLVGYAGVHPSVGQGYEFIAITAVVLGGVVLGGGRGWVLSAVAGAFALELLFTLLTALEVDSTWRDSVQGVIIIAALAVAARAWTVGRGRRTSATTSTTAGPKEPTPGTNTGEN